MIFTAEGFVVPLAEHEALKAERDRLRVISGEEANRIALAALAKEAGQ